MVERAVAPHTSGLRRRVVRAVRTLTTPLLPDDYLGMLHPALSRRELTGRIVAVRAETDEASTVVIRPGRGWPGHRPGQYLRIGAEVDGVRHWRAYTITSAPGDPRGLLSVTVKHVAGGRMSPFYTRAARPGTRVYLGDVEGRFVLPDPVPERVLMISAGSGVTPIAAMLRALDRDGAVGDVVHLHAARTPEGFIFGSELRDLAARRPGYRLHEQLSARDGRLGCGHLDALVSDWRERATFLSGPREMLDAFEAHWAAAGLAGRLATERFQPVIGTGAAAAAGTGGTVRLSTSGVEAPCGPGVSILVGSERAGATMPHGCRMGICHSCVGRLRAGRVRDLRTGEVHGEEGRTVRTCVNAPEGHVEIEL